MEHEGRLCHNDCVPVAIQWICENKLGDRIPASCAPNIEKIITVHADRNKNLEDDDLECGYFMQTLVHDNIVEEVEQFVIADEMSREVQTAAAWEKLMTMEGSVALFATLTLIDNGVPGHVIVCDLDTRSEKNKDGEIIMRDPQVSKNKQKINIQGFKENVLGYGILR